MNRQARRYFSGWWCTSRGRVKMFMKFLHIFEMFSKSLKNWSRPRRVVKYFLVCMLGQMRWELIVESSSQVFSICIRSLEEIQTEVIQYGSNSYHPITIAELQLNGYKTSKLDSALGSKHVHVNSDLIKVSFITH